MWRVVGCITQQHDLRLVGLAACLCALACATTVNLMAGAQNKKIGPAFTHLIAASVVFGCGVWSLHFVAMLAFVAGIPISYGIALTFTSILIAVLGALSALSFWLFCPSRQVGIIVGGLLLGLSVSAMHFCGIMAMRVSGSVHVAADAILYAVGVSFLFSIIALFRSERLSTHQHRLEAAGLLALAICGLHFIAMTGLSVEPGLPVGQQAAVLGSYDLALAVGLSSLAVLIMSLAATLVEQHLSHVSGGENPRINGGIVLEGPG